MALQAKHLHRRVDSNTASPLHINTVCRANPQRC
jgi:hypothetical protein